MHNVEIKSELRDLTIARAICQSINATFILTFDQTDTYFKLPQGRLKRRETQGEPVEYVFYERADRAAPKLSKFAILSSERYFCFIETIDRFCRLLFVILYFLIFDKADLRQRMRQDGQNSVALLR